MLNYGRVRKSRGIYIVGAVNEYDMDEAHSCHERNDASGHDLVFAKQTLIANPTTAQADDDYREGEYGAPPTVEEGWVVGDASASLGWRILVKGTRQYHGVAGEARQTPTSLEGELLGCRVRSVCFEG